MIHRKVTVAPAGKAGFVIEGLPNNTYDETTAKRLQYMKTDGTDEFDFPEDGVFADVPNVRAPAFAQNPSGRPFLE